MIDRSGPALHLDSLASVLKDLGKRGIELYELRYFPEAFGSLELVVGTGHKRVKFTWEGRDAILSVAFATTGNKAMTVPWTHDADISLPKGEGLFAEIASNAEQILAT